MGEKTNSGLTMLYKKILRLVNFCSMLIVLGGCSGGLFPLTPAQIEQKVEVTGLSFDKKVKYTGPTIHSRGKRSSIEDIQLTRLYAERSKVSDEIEYFVLADIMYPRGVRYYRRARFEDSSWVHLKKIKNAKEQCVTKNCYKTYSVRFPVKLSRLVGHSRLDFRLESFTGLENVFSIPRKHIEGFILATKKHRRHHSS